MEIKLILKGKETITKLQGSIVHMPILVEELRKQFKTNDFIITEINY